MQLLEEQARKIAEEAKEDQPLQAKKGMTFVKLVEVMKCHGGQFQPRICD